MNKRLKAKWVKALRSGKYTKTTSMLSRTSLEDGSKSFCCLGVLRDLEPTLEGFAGGNGILDPVGCGIPEKVQQALAGYNDGGKSFAWIASNIERRKSL